MKLQGVGEGRERKTCSKAERQKGKLYVATRSGNSGADMVMDDGYRR